MQPLGHLHSSAHPRLQTTAPLLLQCAAAVWCWAQLVQGW